MCIYIYICLEGKMHIIERKCMYFLPDMLIKQYSRSRYAIIWSVWRKLRLPQLWEKTFEISQNDDLGKSFSSRSDHFHSCLGSQNLPAISMTQWCNKFGYPFQPIYLGMKIILVCNHFGHHQFCFHLQTPSMWPNPLQRSVVHFCLWCILLLNTGVYSAFKWTIQASKRTISKSAASRDFSPKNPYSTLPT